MAKQERTYGPYVVELSHLDKEFFPGDGITKGHLIEYHEKIADRILPHLQDRPISMQRFPDGIEGEGFYQKKAADYFPDWIVRVEVPLREGGNNEQVIVDKEATLVYLVNQGTVTFHPWLSRRDRIEAPDRLIFDLDPPGDDFAAVVLAARQTRDCLDNLGLPAYLLATGSKGLHVVTPLDRSADFDAVRDFAHGVARLLAHRHPGDLTVEPRKDKRKGRLYLDTQRNAYAQTAVAPYTVRPRPGAPVATPLEWDELAPSLRPDQYTIKNIFRRLGQRDDPWADINRRGHSLSSPREKLDSLLAEVRSEEETESDG